MQPNQMLNIGKSRANKTRNQKYKDLHCFLKKKQYFYLNSETCNQYYGLQVNSDMNDHIKNFRDCRKHFNI